MLLLEEQSQNPQIFTDTQGWHEPELIKDGNEYYIRHFLISELHANTNNWKTENLVKWVNSARGYPLIATPGYHHIADPDRETWKKLQKPYAIGDMEQILFNEKYGCYDALTHVTNEQAKSALDKGYMPRFTSPGIHGNKVRYETQDGKIIRVFEDAQIMHSAVVLKPSFPKEIAQINGTACKGTSFLCKKELAAIAEELDLGKILENNFATLNNTKEKNSLEDNMPGEDTKQGSSSHVDILLEKIQNDLAQEKKARELLEEKNKALAESFKTEQEKATALEKEKADLKSKVDAIDKEKQKVALKQAFEEKLKKTKLYFNNDELRNKKVAELVEKDYKVEDIDTLFKDMTMTEDEIKEAQARLQEQNPSIPEKPSIGIAEDVNTTIPTKKANAELIKGATILNDILELRL